MRQMKKKIAVLITAVLSLSAVLTGCGKLNADDIVATVGKNEIRADVANFFARYQQAQSETYYMGIMGENMWKNEMEKGKTYEDTVKETIMNELQNMYILKDHMSDYQVEITEDEKAKIEKSAASFEEVNGLSEKSVITSDKKVVAEVLMLFTIQNKMKVAIGSQADPEVSDEEAAQKSMQYVLFPFSVTDDAGNTTQLTQEEKTTLKDTSTSFLEGAKAAEDFAVYAQEAGYEAQTASFDSKSTVPNATLVEAADKLGEGEYTDVIETENGYYVAKVTSLFDQEATDTKKTQIVDQRKQQLYNETVEDWKKDTDIQVNKGTWKKISFVKQGVIIKDVNTDPYSNGPATDTEENE